MSTTTAVATEATSTQPAVKAWPGLNPRALYSDQTGRITCAEHTAYPGGDIWQWDRWQIVPIHELVEWLTFGLGQMKCEICGRRDAR